jgi:hypothetical protein
MRVGEGRQGRWDGGDKGDGMGEARCSVRGAGNEKAYCAMRSVQSYSVHDYRQCSTVRIVKCSATLDRDPKVTLLHDIEICESDSYRTASNGFRFHRAHNV